MMKEIFLIVEVELYRIQMITNFAKTGNYQDNATIIETTGTAEQSEQDKRFSREKGFQL